MTIHAYLKPSAPNFLAQQTKNLGVNVHNFHYTDFQELGELDEKFFNEHVERLTLKDCFLENKGLTFHPGQYKGLNYDVLIGALTYHNAGTEKIPGHTKKQDIFGTFNTLGSAKEFWKQLLAGEILPTKPLDCKLNLNEVNYAKQASLAVANSVEIRELRSVIDMLTNQIKAQGQIIQERVLTPQA